MKNETNNLYQDALYTSKFRVKGGWIIVISLLLFVFALVALLIFRGEGDRVDSEFLQAATIICSVTIAASVAATVATIVIRKLLDKRQSVCFAIYPNYILIAKSKKTSEPLEQIAYSQITSYTFDHDTSDSSRDSIHDISTSANTFTYKHNTGTIIIESNGIQYKASVDDIAKARELFQKLIPLRETFKS